MFGTVPVHLLLTLILVVNAVLDVAIRKVSETLIILGGIGMVFLEIGTGQVHGGEEVLAVSSLAGTALILGLLWYRSHRKNGTGLGDVEMVVLIGLGFGWFGGLLVLLALFLALVTEKFWPRFCTRYTPADVRHKAPMAVYFAVVSLLGTLMLWPLY
ncbi:hypothetical protein FY534_07420 [Alicyclobacillus sp. TC]|uniref:Prepilin signal peptidase PulO-like enzyme (Type II secretory pathway) n=1 Tax=Alicyclobacillus tolerans TaxID=90970 RepID=A0ABT9M002_9BACL|nr:MULTISPECIES: prepilin peptidase [Alicyclobacillus]MDP9729827.1 prepilin signal peptidase PulO-like enzyme (type II secretory pathway) [Alicyclobacillus tengchongensis]QRF23515.1 hypothetical protein FY534_07420 [Alicyclobacillus sp. TC]